MQHWAPSLPTTLYPELGPHRQGREVMRHRRGSSPCHQSPIPLEETGLTWPYWGRCTSTRLLGRPAYCCMSPCPSSPFHPPPASSPHPPSLAHSIPGGCIPLRAWHRRPSRGTALRALLLNYNLLRERQAFPDSPIDFV